MINDTFLEDVKKAIVEESKSHYHKDTKTYKPSGLECERMMYFMRNAVEVECGDADYNVIGMMQCGTDRHIDLQRAISTMQDWEYLDVAKYLDEKHAEGKCLDVIADEKRGMETHLIAHIKEDNLDAPISFMCDGIVRHKLSGATYLLEIKNQNSHIARNKKEVDTQHLAQITTYCWLLDLDIAFVLYENRDTCELYCPSIKITEDMKILAKEKVLRVERCVQDNVMPPRTLNTRSCKWCKYNGCCKGEVLF